MKWDTLQTDANLPLMCEVLGISWPTAAALAHRGLRSKRAALAYLNPQPALLGDALGLKDAQAAFARIAEALRLHQRIMVYGDYDVDGVMATAILCKALQACEADVHFYIPHREEEGYGLNLAAVRALKADEAELLITCDNGIASLAEIAEAQALGLDVIVIDHHEPGFVDGPDGRTDVLPEALAVIDPKQRDCPYPFKEFCAAGLAFRLMAAFFAYTGRDFAPLHPELLALAAIATVCDIVDLTGENRILVKHGLAALNANKRLNGGLWALIDLKGYGDKPIDTFTLGFVLGPCINATGRLESAELSVRLLLSTDAAEQQKLALNLSALNEERKALTAQCAERALAQAQASAAADEKVLVVVDAETHESIAGIVAGRIKDKLHRPALLLTRGAELPSHPGVPVLKGSGRSVAGYNLFEALYAQRALFIRFGGHAMAAGLTLPEAEADTLRQRLNAACTLTEADLAPVLAIDTVLAPADLTLAQARELAWLAPFGKANREPVFATYGLRVTALRAIDAKNTLIFTFAGEGGASLKGIAFGLNEDFHTALRAAFDEVAVRRILSGFVQEAGLAMDVAYHLETNTYNGKTTVQMRVRDFALKTQRSDSNG